MRYKIILIVFLAFGGHVSSQSLSADSADIDSLGQKIVIKHELSMDVTSLIRQFLRGDSIGFDSPYFLTYKLLMGNQGIRLGLGGRYNRSLKYNEQFADNQVDVDREINMRLGYELRSQLGEKWLGYFGLDAVGLLSQTKTIRDSGIDVITNKLNIWGIGGGPTIGIQFYLTDRLSFSTEGSFYFVYLEEKSFELFQNFPQFNDVIEVNDKQELKITLPSTIYINYTF